MGQTVIRRRGVRETAPDERRLWLRFTDGKIVDKSRCPKGISAFHHWTRIDGVADGEPNAVCKCGEDAAEASGKEEASS